jgi:hypothetical protein
MRVGLIERFKLLLVDYLLGLCNLSLYNLIFLENLSCLCNNQQISIRCVLVPFLFGSQEAG